MTRRIPVASATRGTAPVAALAAVLAAGSPLPASVQEWPDSAPATAELAGVYDDGGEEILVVAPVNDTLVRYRDLGSGRLGVLARTTDPGRYAAYVAYAADSVEIVFTPAPGGRITAASWTLTAHGDSAPRTSGRRRALRHETLTWRNGAETLAGTLVLPQNNGSAYLHGPGDGPRCAIVVQPGASWITRYGSNALETAYTFAAHGVAALAYDKRGWGESTGERMVAFETSAADLAGAVDALRGRFDIDPGAIGVWALSQGAWIAPLAGTLTDGISFFVLVGAPGTNPARQEIQRAGALLEALGRPPEQVEAIRRFQEISFRYSVTGRGWDDYRAARALGERQGWLRHVWSPAEPGPDNFLWGRLNGYFNPLPALLALDEPVLAVWGEHDVNVLPSVHLSIFEVALDAAGNEAATLEVVPRAEHVLQVAASRDPNSVEDRFAPGVLGRMTEWVRQVCAERAGSGSPSR